MDIEWECNRYYYAAFLLRVRWQGLIYVHVARAYSHIIGPLRMYALEIIDSDMHPN
jgi:hypothetical protein